MGEAVALRITSFKESMHCLGRNLWTVQYGFQIALYAAHRSLQLMCDVLCELSFQSGLLFFLSYIVYRYLERAVLEYYAFHGEYTSVFRNMQRYSFLFFRTLLFVFL